MTGRLDGVEVEVDAHWRVSEGREGIAGAFRVHGPGARVIADAFEADGEVVFSGPVERDGERLDVVVRVRIESFPTRGEPEAEHRGAFRSTGAPIEATPRDGGDDRG